MVTPGPVLPLDKLITGETPTFASPEEVEAFEQTPYDERIAAKSTYEAIQIGARLNPSAPAIEFLPNADADEDPIAISYGDFVANVTRAANLFTSLGVGKDDVVSMLTPLVPQSFLRCLAPKRLVSPIRSIHSSNHTSLQKFSRPPEPRCWSR